MKIHNIRLGHATNSSSSHSIIFDPTITPTDSYSDFGWEYFTVTSSEAKSQYIASTVYSSFRELPNDMVDLIIGGLGLPVMENDEWGTTEYTVDHESLYLMPHEYGTNVPSVQFIKEFKDYLLQEGIHILGGNDNDSTEHTLLTDTNKVTFGNWKPETDGYTCRKDGQWWTLFDRASGNRITFSFEDNPEEYKPVTPMLLDYKLNENCSHSCQFCLVPDTMIQGKNGLVSISKIGAGDVVMVYDIDSDEVKEEKVKEVYVRDYDGEMVEITAEDGSSIMATPNHEVYTDNRGWIEAGNLLEGDVIVSY